MLGVFVDVENSIFCIIGCIVVGFKNIRGFIVGRTVGIDLRLNLVVLFTLGIMVVEVLVLKYFMVVLYDVIGFFFLGGRVCLIVDAVG